MSTKEKKKKNPFLGFINFTLNDVQKKAINDGLLDPDGVINAVTNWVEEGYSVSIKWDYYSDCFHVSLVGVYTKGSTAGRAVSARHKDFSTAVATIHFITNVWYEGGEWADEKWAQDEFNW